MKTKVLTVLKRILAYFLVLVGLSILIFVIVRIMPGDTARMALGPRAPEEAVEALREEMHLNDSYIVQYGHWIAGILEGDFGESIVTKRPVLDDIKSYLPATLELALITAVLIIVFGILLGIVSTKYSGNGWTVSSEPCHISEYALRHSYGLYSPCCCSPICCRYSPYPEE